MSCFIAAILLAFPVLIVYGFALMAIVALVYEILTWFLGSFGFVLVLSAVAILIFAIFARKCENAKGRLAAAATLFLSVVAGANYKKIAFRFSDIFFSKAWRTCIEVLAWFFDVFGLIILGVVISVLAFCFFAKKQKEISHRVAFASLILLADVAIFNWNKIPQIIRGETCKICLVNFDCMRYKIMTVSYHTEASGWKIVRTEKYCNASPLSLAARKRMFRTLFVPPETDDIKICAVSEWNEYEREFNFASKGKQFDSHSKLASFEYGSGLGRRCENLCVLGMSNQLGLKQYTSLESYRYDIPLPFLPYLNND